MIPEHLPGEPVYAIPSGVGLWARVVAFAVVVALLATLLAPLWLVYLLLVARHGRPPNVPRQAQIARYLRAAWTVSPPPPGLSAGRRAWLTLLILRKAATIPWWGTAWLLDEVLYGRRLDAVRLDAPLFEISAGRSGSTQLARYLEDDPALAAPSFLQSTFPYLWAWRLLPPTVGRVITAERVRHTFEGMLPEEFKERHEGDPFRTDTFEATLYLAHLNGLALFFGPEFGAAEFGAGVLTAENRAAWEEDFVALVDRIGRKHLLWVGATGGERRLFVKGHFLAAAPALARRFPDARFLAMVRPPARRLQSAANYLRANPFDPTLGPPPWGWLGEGLVRSEVAYCEAEQAFYGAPEGPRRCVVRFDDYVRDLPGTMARIYRECLDRAPPDRPWEHAARRRDAYRLDRTLAQVGIDEAALDARLAEYRAWSSGG